MTHLDVNEMTAHLYEQEVEQHQHTKQLVMEKDKEIKELKRLVSEQKTKTLQLAVDNTRFRTVFQRIKELTNMSV